MKTVATGSTLINLNEHQRSLLTASRVVISDVHSNLKSYHNHDHLVNENSDYWIYLRDYYKDYFTDIFETIVKMKHTIKRILLCKRLSNETFIEIDLADDRNVLIIL